MSSAVLMMEDAEQIWLGMPKRILKRKITKTRRATKRHRRNSRSPSPSIGRLGPRTGPAAASWLREQTEPGKHNTNGALPVAKEEKKVVVF